MEFNRFDIIAAHYLFCCEWYNGMSDPLYARQCKISKYYNPGPMDRGWDSLSYNAREIYYALCEKHGFKCPRNEDMDEDEDYFASLAAEESSHFAGADQWED